MTVTRKVRLRCQSFSRAKEQNHIGNVHRIPHAAGRLLQCISIIAELAPELKNAYRERIISSFLYALSIRLPS